MTEIFLAPFLLGLSSGIYCLSFCVPFLAPLMVSEQREKTAGAFLILRFLLGRLFGYMVFGGIFGYLGETINMSLLNFFSFFVLILLSLLLISHSLGLLAENRFKFCRRIKSASSKTPFLIGFLMGINICPPFLMSLTYVFTLHSVWAGIIYFLMFFIATSLYFLPLIFLGRLTPIKDFRWAGRISGLIVGSLFFCYALYNILSLSF